MQSRAKSFWVLFAVTGALALVLIIGVVRRGDQSRGTMRPSTQAITPSPHEISILTNTGTMLAKAVASSAISTPFHSQPGSPDKPSAAVGQLVADLRRPRLEVLRSLAPSDLPALVAIYKKQTNLLDKLAITCAFPFVGGEEAVELLKSTLLRDYMGERFGSNGSDGRPDEEETFFASIRSLGLLAQRSDAAYSFLKSGTDPRFWEKHVKWSSERGSDTVGVLTEWSICSLGMTGRPDALEFLEGLKKTALVNTVHRGPGVARGFEGAVVNAVYYLYLARTDGPDSLKLHVNDSLDNRTELLNAWLKTPEGKEWFSWAEESRVQRAKQRESVR